MSYALFKVKGVWHYRFQVGQARVQRSTRERVKSKADPIAQRAYDEAIIRVNGGKLVPTLRVLAAEWLLVHAKVASVAHRRSVETFARLHLYELGDLPVSDITTTHVELARNEHLATHKPASANHWLRILKLLANWAVKREIIPKLPWRVAMLKVQKRPRVILPVDLAAAWFDAVDAAAGAVTGIGTAVRMMLFLGLRESEATSARWEWFDWERTTYTPGLTKGREAEPLPMPGWLVDYLKPLRQPAGLVVSRRNGRRFPAGFARRAMQAANLACATRGVTPHRLRGTIATLMSEEGVSIQNIQKFLRHKSPMTTMAYLEKNMGIAARAQNVIAEKIDIRRRESGEQRAANPH